MIEDTAVGHDPPQAAPHQLRSVRAGDTLAGRFLLHHVIGHGATGTVFAALDRTVGQKVAIKLLHPELDEAARRRVREGEVGLVPGMDEFLDRFGHISDSGNDFSHVPWREDPAVLSPLLEAAVEVRRQDLGPEHPETAAAMSKLGGVLISMGDYQPAKPLLLEALEIQERRLDAADPIVERCDPRRDQGGHATHECPSWRGARGASTGQPSTRRIPRQGAYTNTALGPVWESRTI